MQNIPFGRTRDGHEPENYGLFVACEVHEPWNIMNIMMLDELVWFVKIVMWERHQTLTGDLQLTFF